MRSRMLDIKENMKGNHVNFDCEPCKLKGIKRKETQTHIYKSKQLSTQIRKVK